MCVCRGGWGCAHPLVVQVYWMTAPDTLPDDYVALLPG